MRITQGCFSFLPDLTDDQILTQVQYCLDNGSPSSRGILEGQPPSVDHIIQIAPGALETGTTAFSVAAPGIERRRRARPCSTNRSQGALPFATPPCPADKGRHPRNRKRLGRARRAFCQKSPESRFPTFRSRAGRVGECCGMGEGHTRYECARASYPAAGGGGGGLSRGASGADARSGSARLGGDADESRPARATAPMSILTQPQIETPPAS